MIGIRAIGTYITQNKLSNYDRQDEFSITPEFIENKIGFKALAQKSPEEETSDLCVKAFENLNQEQEINLEKVDCLVLCTQNPDGYGLPHSSAIIHEKLGLPLSCAVFDISLGCSGYVYGLSIVKSFMESNGFKYGLFFTGDPYSKVIDLQDKSTSLLFGDAAAVTLMTEEPLYQIKAPLFGSDGRGHRSIMVKGTTLEMNGRAVYTFAVRTIPGNIRDMLAKNSLTVADVDLFILHQGSKKIVDAIAEQLEIEADRAPFLAGDYGNTVSSSIPLILKEYLINSSHQNIALAGFGVGLSWGSILIQKT